MDDTEDLRRERNSRRWRLRSPSERETLMEALAERDPALHTELVALRSTNPQAWRKRLVATAQKLEVYAPKTYPEREKA